MKMTLHIYAVEPQYMLWNLHPKLDVGNISAVKQADRFPPVLMFLILSKPQLNYNVTSTQL